MNIIFVATNKKFFHDTLSNILIAYPNGILSDSLFLFKYWRILMQIIRIIKRGAERRLREGGVYTGSDLLLFCNTVKNLISKQHNSIGETIKSVVAICRERSVTSYGSDIKEVIKFLASTIQVIIYGGTDLIHHYSIISRDREEICTNYLNNRIFKNQKTPFFYIMDLVKGSYYIPSLKTIFSILIHIFPGIEKTEQIPIAP